LSTHGSPPRWTSTGLTALALPLGEQRRRHLDHRGTAGRRHRFRRWSTPGSRYRAQPRSAESGDGGSKADMADSTAGGGPAFDSGDPDVYSRQVLSWAARRRARRLAMEDGHPDRAVADPRGDQGVPTVGP
jgi:hypothetical protein